ncbi:hypothetical protein ABPG74_004815 [Tetrahymena malaccensis]
MKKKSNWRSNYHKKRNKKSIASKKLNLQKKLLNHKINLQQTKSNLILAQIQPIKDGQKTHKVQQVNKTKIFANTGIKEDMENQKTAQNKIIQINKRYTCMLQQNITSFFKQKMRQDNIILSIFQQQQLVKKIQLLEIIEKKNILYFMLYFNLIQQNKINKKTQNSCQINKQKQIQRFHNLIGGKNQKEKEENSCSVF